ncbi:dephospho-CoA kinase [Metabacillus niabensis]|uniref:Dephospho-CoA kinase n=1 Tax=Metabacillus niabensis TaxID=324854 RepID=A0ABT9YXC1_9BACI|nr:dephospho-CoA kinase [Metabacillus niabensis]MDQ0224635.1 dephospho-CoA kinase [Metabacillus niabensis]
MTIVIGLTGGIASGKSTVSNMIRKQGLRVVDADIIAREVVEIGQPAYKKIIETFDGILDEDKSINRQKLGSIIFADEKKRQQLNSIVHPAVREEMLKQVESEKQKNALAVVLDIPLLFESKLTHIVDKTILVYVDEHIQLERLMGRNGYTEHEARMRIESQMPLKEKLKLADYVINNNGTLEETERQLRNILDTIIWNLSNND